MGSDSPVKRDSFTSTAPDRITESEQTWFPPLNSVTSSSTSSYTGISESFPSRTTFAIGMDKRESLSTSLLAWISWAMPISVLRAMIRIKSMLDHAPTSAKATAISTLNRLNNVQILSFKICPVVLVTFSGSVFCRPSRRFSSTCSEVSPKLLSGEKCVIERPHFHLFCTAYSSYHNRDF